MSVVTPEIGNVYRLVRPGGKSIPFYDGVKDKLGTSSGTELLASGSLVLFIAEERNWHWPNEEWYWWRVYCLNTREIGFIMNNAEDLRDL